jgi:hypothetical protein
LTTAAIAAFRELLVVCLEGSSQGMTYEALSKLEHDREKSEPVFGSCSNNKLERDDDSKKSHPALVPHGTSKLSAPTMPLGAKHCRTSI